MAPKFLNIAAPGDYRISTWLLLGATLQSILVATLPRTISLLPPILFLIHRIFYNYLIATGRLPNPLETDVVHGRQTWKTPPSPSNNNNNNNNNKTNTAEDPNDTNASIVVLVIAASWAHPNGLFSPGSQQLGDYFHRMWASASAHRTTYGFLGNTPGLSSHDTGSRPDEQGKTVLYLSYWKTLAGLQKFAHGDAHMKGQLWWEKGAGDAFPHIGIMHETYEVPAGGWENVFHNFRPFAIASAKYPVSSAMGPEGEGVETEAVEWVSGLRGADRKDWRTMLGRMGRKVGAGGMVGCD